MAHADSTDSNYRPIKRPPAPIVHGNRHVLARLHPASAWGTLTRMTAEALKEAFAENRFPLVL